MAISLVFYNFWGTSRSSHLLDYYCITKGYHLGWPGLPNISDNCTSCASCRLHNVGNRPHQEHLDVVVVICLQSYH